MEHLPEILKQFGPLVAAVFAALLPLFKHYREGTHLRTKALQERYERIKVFFEEQGREGAHPLQLEAAFAAAVGKGSFSAREIPVLLRQQSPSHFIATYARVQDYVGLSDDGSRLVLQSLATKGWVRRGFAAGGIALYLVLVLGTLAWFAWSFPGLLRQGNWATLGTNLLVSILPVAVGVYCLHGAARLHWAAVLVERQAVPMTEAERSEPPA